MKMTEPISEVLLTEQQIQRRVQELGAAIAADYAGLDPVLVGVLRGVVVFMADLIRAIPIPFSIDFLAITSYGAQAGPGQVKLLKDLEVSIEGRHVLFIDDMVDTGLTLHTLLRLLRARDPASLHVCTLFDKPRLRLVKLPLRYVGFDLPDRYVVGYGLDYRQRYRNLPFVGTLSAHVLLPGGNAEQRSLTPLLALAQELRP
jgi:hypoxanthine phosphoribosyltransferase